MKKFIRYGFPAVYGLALYTTIRLFTDADSDRQFWTRSWELNTGEICYTLGLAYFSIWRHNKLFAWFNKKWPVAFNQRQIFKELGYVVLLNLVILNCVAIPFVAFTDDGLQPIDLICVNLVPMFFSLVYYGVARSTHFLKAFVTNQLMLEKIANDQLQTELKFLKAQYHPHFLFNALNTIYFQMDEDVKAAKVTVEKFSELLRYQLYDQQQTVPVSQEIQYLRSFTQLQSVRTSEKLQLTEDYDSNLNGEHIYPLLFLPLVENAFKYVGGSYNIEIALKKHLKGMEFTVGNSVPENIPCRQVGGIGLENLKRRLQLLYPDKHELNIYEGKGTFLVKLNLVVNS